MSFKLITIVLLYVLSVNSVKYRFPQFNKAGMKEEDFLATERIESINSFVESFRGW